MTIGADLKQQTCLVTGGAGFIGSHLVARLVDLGARVRVLDNLSTGYLDNLQPWRDAIEFTEGDASDEGTVESAVDGCDYVFHLAAMASVPRSMAEPVLCHDWVATSTVRLLSACARADVRRFVLASTSAAYGDSPFVAKRETDPAAPLSPYAAAKLAAEQYCHAFSRSGGIETAALRYFNVFGPRQDPQSEYSAVIPRFVSMILSGERPIIYGDGGQSRDFVYVDNVIDANLLAATVPEAAGGTFNVACGSSTTLLELLDWLRDLLGQEIEPIHEPPRVGDVRDSLADITQARSVLGYEPRVTVADGLARSVEYYKTIATANS
ncbi:SDR family oxidoreductase [Roseimaritima ulvae]|uniref:UDP-glucose 4-epimerase n=1 Tax=Roseimaritima ulvae TaxID=980254 RepID=A0A5B9QZ25_9BACT|nr:SDR family oxidoreductase [Roseimaritima ulvae]QEG42416.1 UDP-glucose 4-epimerase [Roseimaritima ulvae]